jgi:hypothetical protein
VGVEFFHADRRTDITKLIFAYRNFANASKKKWEGVDWISFAQDRDKLLFAVNTVEFLD